MEEQEPVLRRLLRLTHGNGHMQGGYPYEILAGTLAHRQIFDDFAKQVKHVKTFEYSEDIPMTFCYMPIILDKMLSASAMVLVPSSVCAPATRPAELLNCLVCCAPLEDLSTAHDCIGVRRTRAALIAAFAAPTFFSRETADGINKIARQYIE